MEDTRHNENAVTARKQMMLKRALLLSPLMLLVGTAIAFLLYSPASDAKPQVELAWSPDQLVKESVAPGTTVTYKVVMTNVSKTPLTPTNQLRIVAEGNIAPYITIKQPVFPKGNLPRGAIVSFDVIVSTPADEPVNILQGSLVLTRTLPNGQVKDVWRDQALYAELTVSPITIPPDPGEAGNLTIEGIDSDRDGVRDDVQRWIAFKTYPTESGHAALIQNARAMQSFLLATTDEDVIAAAHASSRAGECLNFVRGGTEESIKLRALLRAEMLNTQARSEEYINKQPILSGQFLGSDIWDWQYQCDFDPWAMDD